MKEVGPDRILPATNFFTTRPDGAIKLRLSKDDPIKPGSVPTMLRRAAAAAPDHPALAVKRSEVWVQWTYSKYLADVEAAARAMIALGLQNRHSVAIIGFNAPERFIADLAAIFAGGISAGIYTTNSPESCKYIAQHSHANIIIAEDAEQVEKFTQFREELKDLRAIVQYTGVPSPESGTISWAEFMAIGRNMPKGALEDRLREMAINQCCRLVYTSGTTGPPKGVMVSHDNILFHSVRSVKILGYREKLERVVSYLPLSHVAATIVDIFIMIQCVGTVYFADKSALKGGLVDTLKETQPTIFFGVPRVWEKIREKMVQAGKGTKGAKLKLVKWAKRVGLQNDRRSLSFKVAKFLVFKNVKTALGLANCHTFISAAAPISLSVLEFFASLDIRIFEVYGVTEMTGPHIGNEHVNNKAGTVGKEQPGTFIKLQKRSNISVPSEFCLKGRNLMMGYLEDEAAMEAAIDGDGWFWSGDLGTKDEDGFFTIVGRSKEIIITAGGENVAPVPIEDRIKAELPCISNAVVIGDKRKFLSCLLTLKVSVNADTGLPEDRLAPMAVEWCASTGSKALTITDALTDDKVLEAVNEGIDRANEASVSNAQKIRKWSLLETELSIPGGELGPTMKVKRHVVLNKYSGVVDEMYHERADKAT